MYTYVYIVLVFTRHAYKEGLKEIEFEPEERDDNNAL